MDDYKCEDDSLMESINALFAPPSGESQTMKEDKISTAGLQNQNKNADDLAWKKPKANSHDYCDSCGCTEGERLVCDRCPVSFHLECLDPPMESDEATTGIWYCPSCTVIMKEDDNTSSCSDMTDNTRLTKEYQNIFFSLKQQLGELVDHRSTRSANFNYDSIDKDIDENSPLYALWEIMRMTKYINPKEYDLPKDLVPGIKFPGSYKTPLERKKKSIIELECGQIPEPIKRCYVCAKTCLLAPLLCCDFCDSAFHLNCLDPPMAHYPPRMDRWMCPNHCEHTIDQHFVKSIRLSDRMKQWDNLKFVETCSNIDQDILSKGDTYKFSGFSKQEERQIIEQFMYRINQNRMQVISEKLKLEEIRNGDQTKSKKMKISIDDGKMRVVVPPAVKSLYRNRIRPIKSEVNVSYSHVVEEEIVKFLVSLINEKKEENNCEKIDEIVHVKENFPKDIYQIKGLRSRAMIIPLDDTSGPVFHMQYKQLKIGVGSEAFLNFDYCQLKDSVKCSRVSSYHAQIFFDEQTRLFELINYSENGSLIDNILYGFNNEQNQLLESNDLSKRARKIIDKHSKENEVDSSAAPPLFTPKKRIQTASKECYSCSCEDEDDDSKGYRDSGWEGSAVLHHGSLLKFGCYQFVFSIISPN